MIQSDVFVVADNLQYSKHSLVNRTKIKTPDGFKWLTVPVVKSKKGLQRINEVRIVPESNWQRKQQVSLKSNYKYAPFFDHYFYKFEKVFHSNWKSIWDLDLSIMNSLQKQLRLKQELNLLSDLNIDQIGTERIIELAKRFDCDTYLIYNSESAYVNENKLNDAGISLIAFKPELRHYRQQFEPFIPNLSIIDLLFNLGNESVAYFYSCVK